VPVKLPVEDFGSYRRVDSFAELRGPGSRLLELPPERVPRAPLEVAAGEPRRRFREDKRPVQLRCTKVARALCVKRGVIVDLDTGRVLSDGFRPPLPTPSAPVEVDLSELGIDASVDWKRVPARKEVGTGFYADSWHLGYGHVLLEGLSRCWALEHVQPLQGIVVANKRGRHLYWPWFEALGVTPDRLLSTRGGPLRVDNLFVPSPSYVLNRAMSPRFPEMTRRISRSLDEGTGSQFERLYVSRRDAPKRRLSNEAEIEELFRSNGFHVFHPTEHPIEEQVRAFAGASVVAGPVGSGLYSIAFSPPGTRLIVLAPAEFYTPNDLILAGARDHPPAYAFGHSQSQRPEDAMLSDWHLDQAAAKAAIERVLPNEPAAGKKRIAGPPMRMFRALKYYPEDPAKWNVPQRPREDIGIRFITQRATVTLPDPLDRGSSDRSTAYDVAPIALVELRDGAVSRDGSFVFTKHGELLRESVDRLPSVEELSNRLNLGGDLDSVVPEPAPEAVAVIGSQRAVNYFHWWIDVLARCWVIRSSPYRSCHLVTPPLMHDFQLDTLNLLRQHVTSLTRPLQRFRHLVLVRGLTYGASQAIVPQVTEFAQWCRTMLELSPSRRDRKLFLSRKSAPSRRLVNEEEVVRALGPDIEPVALETLSVREQASLFSEASLVVAPHGAGLTNLLFCERPAAVVELVHADTPPDTFRRLAGLLDHPYIAVGCEPEKHPQKKEGRRNMKAAVDDVVSAVERAQQSAQGHR